MFAIAVLLFELATPFSASIKPRGPVVCDDGSSPWNADKTPNWRCTIEGCPPSASVCWTYRLARCVDAAGRDLGVCNYRRKECHSRFGCFVLYLTCVGQFKCTASGDYGCYHGSCLKATDSVPASSTDEDIAEGPVCGEEHGAGITVDNGTNPAPAASL